MDITTKAVSATITDTSSGPDEFPGTFLVELSNESLDRDGDTLKADEWEQPFPDRITFVNDHTHKMASVVGSAVPELVDGKVICKGDWAATTNGQETRKVIPHVPYTSVAYREKRTQKGGVTRELINGSFVVVPSNPKAKVLASKAFAELADETLVSELSIKQFGEMLKDSLDTDSYGKSYLPEGFVADVELDTAKDYQTLQIKDAEGKVLLTHKFSPTPNGAHDDTSDSAADLVKEKAAAQALAAAFEITSRTYELEG
jgi:hypothetical protein